MFNNIYRNIEPLDFRLWHSQPCADEKTGDTLRKSESSKLPPATGDYFGESHPAGASRRAAGRGVAL